MIKFREKCIRRNPRRLLSILKTFPRNLTGCFEPLVVSLEWSETLANLLEVHEYKLCIYIIVAVQLSSYIFTFSIGYINTFSESTLLKLEAEATK